MKRILIALAILGLSVASASATCTGPAVMKDNATTTFNMSLATNAGDGNCASNVAVPDGGEVTIGAKADAKNAATDTTPITAMSIWKQISASIQAAASSLASLVTGQSTGNTSLATIATNTGAAIPAGSALIGKVGIDQTTDGTTNGVRLTNGYPAGATPITASATGTTAATTATLAGTTGKTTYICGYSIRANATGAATVTNTITGVITATLSSIMWVAPLASGIGIDEQIFSPCIPASGTNQAIAIVSGAPGSGGTVSSKGWGYQQ